MPSGMLTLDNLARAVEADEIDTVIIAIPDMQGRLSGKRLSARMYLDQVAEHGAFCGASILAVDAAMDLLPGYAIANGERGFGDIRMRPDPTTLRCIPWWPGTALVIADAVAVEDDTAIDVSSRAVLAAQIARLADQGVTALVGTELEFLVFDETYREAFDRGYRELTTSTPFSPSYSVSAQSSTEPMLRAIRRGMDGAGMYCESIKGECSPGQQEVAFRYGDALRICDNHVVFKHGAKEIADQFGRSVSFMAKYDPSRGNSCHIHLSLRDQADDPAFVDAAGTGMSVMFTHFVAGVLSAMREMMPFYAPNINSYKRFADGSLAPTKVAWGRDNRTCAVRVVGSGESMRLECRVPGADANPYLAVAALIASGLHGIQRQLTLDAETAGDAYRAAGESLPTSLAEATELFAHSNVAKAAFGESVVAHYATYGRNESALFEKAITDWERVRGFERL